MLAEHYGKPKKRKIVSKSPAKNNKDQSVKTNQKKRAAIETQQPPKIQETYKATTQAPRQSIFNQLKIEMLKKIK